MALFDNREDVDPVILEETILSVTIDGQEYQLFTCQDFSYDETADKEVRPGPGRKKGMNNLRVLRKDTAFTWSMTLDEPNTVLLGTLIKNGIEIACFEINGVQYTSLMDLPPFTITNSFPAQDGTVKVKRLLKAEFTKNSGKIAVGDASQASVEGIALGGEGMF